MTQLMWDAVARRDPKQRPLVMAHRGVPDLLAENTLGSFQLALEQGADVLETDVRLTRDAALVLMHDATVERTTDGAGAVEQMTLSEFKRLKTRWSPMMEGHVRRSGQPRPGPEPEEPPPTLEELLALTRGRVPLALELKDDRFIQPRDAERLTALLDRYDARDSSVLVSFSLARLRTFRALGSPLRLGAITMSNPLPLFPTEFLGPAYPLLYLNPLYAGWARRLGRIVCPLDIAPESRLGYYRRLGLTILMTNHPDETLTALAGYYPPRTEPST